MVARVRSASAASPDRGRQRRTGYYAGEPPIEFVSTGCTVLDCVLGGGWALGRFANIVGDKAVGKTLIAIEAAANFAAQYPGGHIWYREVEAAFDVAYAEQVGLPAGRVDFGPDGVDSMWETVEDIYEDLYECVVRAEKSGQPGLYIVDSLDALSSRAELARAIDKGSYGTDKAAVLSELFRRLKKRIKKARVGLIIVSQIRDRIGAQFGEKYRRTGGHALDFYASHIIWLHHRARIRSKVGGVERTVGVRIRARCRKNKVVATDRECEFVVRFGFGVDDIEACVSYLAEVGALDRIGLGIKKKDVSREVSAFLRQCARMSDDELRAKQAELSAVVRDVWQEVEDRFRPRQRKYGAST